MTATIPLFTLSLVAALTACSDDKKAPKSEAPKSESAEADQTKSTKKRVKQATAADKNDLMVRVRDWAYSWEDNVIDTAYYARNYHSSFEGTTGKKTFGKDGWVKDKTKKANKVDCININVSDIAVDFENAEKAEVRFKQQYVTDNYCDIGKKTQTWIKDKGKWQITSEEQPKNKRCPNRCNVSFDNLTGLERHLKENVQNWAYAWQDNWYSTRAYSKYYHPDFVGRNGKKIFNKRDWVKDKSKKANRTECIEISVSDFDIQKMGDIAQVSFKQEYVSATYCDIGIKTQEWKWNGRRWQIITEKQPKSKRCNYQCSNYDIDHAEHSD